MFLVGTSRAGVVRLFLSVWQSNADGRSITLQKKLFSILERLRISKTASIYRILFSPPFSTIISSLRIIFFSFHIISLSCALSFRQKHFKLVMPCIQSYPFDHSSHHRYSPFEMVGIVSHDNISLIFLYYRRIILVG